MKLHGEDPTSSSIEISSVIAIHLTFDATTENPAWQ